MGNSQSNEEALNSPSTKSSPAPHQRLYARERSREKPTATATATAPPGSLRKPQSHAAIRTAATPASPTATLVPSPPTASTSSTNTNVTATVSHSPAASAHSRARSITHAVPGVRGENPVDIIHRNEISPMGNTESRTRPPSSQQSPAPTTTTHLSPATEKGKAEPSPQSQPVDVPQPHDGLNEKEVFAPSGLPIADESPYGLSSGPSRFDRPPRLPLPIEQEPHAPGSPIFPPQDLQPALDEVDVVGPLPRRASVLSSTTVDEDDVIDQDAFVTETQSSAYTVPVKVTWRGADFGDKKLYVTGTFVSWDRKYKMQRDKDNKETFSTILQLQPGTHHLKFLVNSNDQILSDDLPTTVDYTNMLVNYIEVPAQQPPATSTQVPVPAEPMPIPGATTDVRHETVAPSKPLDIPTAPSVPETAGGPPSTLHDIVATDFKEPVSIPHRPSPAQAASPHHPQPTSAPPKKRAPRPKYTSDIPEFLVDLDRPNQEDEEYQRAKRIEPHLPQPPSLPMFLGKSILNGTTPHKDDASVLIMPNHTVLNHLATSSIKHGVLATSGTTRYKRKFLTTIMYKPTSDDG